MRNLGQLTSVISALAVLAAPGQSSGKEFGPKETRQSLAACRETRKNLWKTLGDKAGQLDALTRSVIGFVGVDPGKDWGDDAQDTVTLIRRCLAENPKNDLAANVCVTADLNKQAGQAMAQAPVTEPSTDCNKKSSACRDLKICEGNVRAAKTELGVMRTVWNKLRPIFNRGLGREKGCEF